MAFVVEEAIRGTVARVVIGNWIVILIESQVIHVHAEIDIESSVAVVVGNRGMGEGSLRLASKFECIAL